MIKYKKKLCLGCNTPQFLFGYKLCKVCYNKKKAAEKKLKANKPRKPIKKVSDKHKNLLNQYGKVRAEFLKENPCCAVNLPGCSECHPSLMQVHHRAGRIGPLLLDKTKFLAVCYSCHIFLEAHPLLAYEKGWSISRIGIDNMDKTEDLN